jgi:hypothetical protein
MALMKTTLTLSDEIFREAKARAALRGQSLGKFMEQSLVKALAENGETQRGVGPWLRSLPSVSPTAAADLEQILAASDFRRVDEAMWQ